MPFNLALTFQIVTRCRTPEIEREKGRISPAEATDPEMLIPANGRAPRQREMSARGPARPSLDTHADTRNFLPRVTIVARSGDAMSIIARPLDSQSQNLKAVVE
jgi:hypothetical protein